MLSQTSNVGRVQSIYACNKREGNLKIIKDGELEDKNEKGEFERAKHIRGRQYNRLYLPACRDRYIVKSPVVP